MSIASEPRPYPTHLDLPHTDNQPVENYYQPIQSWLLLDTLNSHLRQIHPDGNYSLGTDAGIYYRRTTPPLQGCRAPDFFYVPGVPKLLDGAPRRSYVMWAEGVRPLLVIEYVSGNGDDERDDTPETGKFWIYEREIQAKYYLIWNPDAEKLEAFELVDGRYEPMNANANDRFPIPEMELEFGIWEGSFDDTPALWLRSWTPEGDLILSSGEAKAEAESLAEGLQRRVYSERRKAESEKQRAEAEKQRAEAEKLQKEKLAAKLRELGIDPDQV
jgi:Uma2 family endonuclease